MEAPTFEKIKVLEEVEDSLVLDLDIRYPSEAAVKVSYSSYIYH